MVKLKVDSSVEETTKELLDLLAQDKVKKQIQKEILKQSSRFRISPVSETLEIEVSIEVKKSRR
jgi:hypothetical protein